METSEKVIYIVFIGSLVFLSLLISVLIFVIFHKKTASERKQKHIIELKQKELELLNKIIETQEQERSRIAQNLHDNVNPFLSGLKMSISLAKKKMNVDQVVLYKIENQLSMIDDIFDNTTLITRDLSPRNFYKDGLVSAINSFFDSIQEVEISKEVILLANDKMNDPNALSVYRMILEITQNTIKHDQPSEIKYKIQVEKDHFVFFLEHNGIGISQSQFNELLKNSDGIGLNSLVSRASILSAKIEYNNETKACIKLSIPSWYA
ncbi:MAG: hypothetical protein EP305_04460 [Bacteroidetes bacterium]|nr:MAG: hypothetical protein EP305_04460 [Bacteroidota bacterium]